MPEGPSMIFLKEKVVSFIGEKVISVDGNAHKFEISRLLNNKIIDFKTYGKEFLICFKEFTVRIHLQLFGSYSINARKSGKLRLGLTFGDGELNFYACDASLIEQPLEEIYDWSVEVMNDLWDPKKALKKLKEMPETLMCDALLDQHIFAGVGNKLKDEVLFAAKVHPESLVGKVPTKNMNMMLKDVVKKSFEYLQWEHDDRPEGFLKIHQKKICPIHETALASETLGKSKRNTEYCEKCQKLYK